MWWVCVTAGICDGDCQPKRSDGGGCVPGGSAAELVWRFAAGGWGRWGGCGCPGWLRTLWVPVCSGLLRPLRAWCPSLLLLVLCWTRCPPSSLGADASLSVPLSLGPGGGGHFCMTASTTPPSAAAVHTQTSWKHLQGFKLVYILPDHLDHRYLLDCLHCCASVLEEASRPVSDPRLPAPVGPAPLQSRWRGKILKLEGRGGIFSWIRYGDNWYCYWYCSLTDCSILLSRWTSGLGGSGTSHCSSSLGNSLMSSFSSSLFRAVGSYTNTQTHTRFITQ